MKNSLRVLKQSFEELSIISKIKVRNLWSNLAFEKISGQIAKKESISIAFKGKIM
jgi:hypothetical protein